MRDEFDFTIVAAVGRIESVLKTMFRFVLTRVTKTNSGTGVFL